MIKKKRFSKGILDLILASVVTLSGVPVGAADFDIQETLVEEFSADGSDSTQAQENITGAEDNSSSEADTQAESDTASEAEVFGDDSTLGVASTSTPSVTPVSTATPVPTATPVTPWPMSELPVQIELEKVDSIWKNNTTYWYVFSSNIAGTFYLQQLS